MHSARFFSTFWFLIATSVVQAAGVTSLLSNGDLEASKDGKSPVDWPTSQEISWLEEGSNHFIRLRSPAPGVFVNAYRAVALPPEVRALELTYRVRYEGIEKGTESWFDGRIMMNFKDQAKTIVSPGPNHPSFSGTSKGWVERTHQFRVPPGASMLELIFALFNTTRGQIDFDDVRLTSIDPKLLDKAEQAAASQEAIRLAALPKPMPHVAVPPVSELPPPLRVAGNRLVNPEGKEVWLQGLAIPSMEWSAGGENILKSIEEAVVHWRANCVRLCLDSKFYEGKGPYQNDGGLHYQQLVEDAVNLCAGHGAYIVLDLHEYRAPTTKHADFWRKVAAKYKNHPSVVFELLNEPHDISWEVWRNGGDVIDRKTNKEVATENREALTTFSSIGMQKLVDTIREAGALNLIVAGGLDWSYDLSGILAGFALDDPKGNGIMYSSHVYPWKRDWQVKFLDAAAKYPLFLGECGADAKPMEFIPASAQEDPATWVPDLLGLVQKYRLNWTAWCFHPSATPRVLLDWQYTPTPFWGKQVKGALAGETFELKRLR